MDQVITNELIDSLRNIFASYLISIILYGSVARGSDTNESDVDIAIILKDKPDAEMLELLLL